MSQIVRTRDRATPTFQNRVFPAVQASGASFRDVLGETGKEVAETWLSVFYVLFEVDFTPWFRIVFTVTTFSPVLGIELRAFLLSYVPSFFSCF